MKIAIIGAGNVGGALGGRLARKDHHIRYGVRDPANQKYAALKSSANSTLTTPADAVQSAEVVLLATPWGAVQQAIKELGPLEGKILVDCTNPIKADFSGLEVGHTTSGGEMVAGWAKGAKVVKCFNHTGYNNMEQPDYGGSRPVMFAAGDHPEAVKTVASLARDAGFDAVELKGIQMSRQLEQLAWLWIAMAVKQNFGRDFAFALLRR